MLVVIPYHMERCWSVSLPVQGCALSWAAGRVGREGAGLRASRSIGNLSKGQLSPAQQLPPFPLSESWKERAVSSLSQRIYCGAACILGYCETSASHTAHEFSLSGTDLKAQSRNSCQGSSEGRRHPGKVCRNKQMDAA